MQFPFLVYYFFWDLAQTQFGIIQLFGHLCFITLILEFIMKRVKIKIILFAMRLKLLLKRDNYKILI